MSDEMYKKIEQLRVKATCRCKAISTKVNKVIGTVEYDEQYHACCWVCCDCSIDRMW